MFLVLCVQVITLFYYGSRKAGFHEDELYSYYSSNKTAGLFVNDREWTSGESFRNELVVLPGEQFRYGVVKQMQSWDVHPPLYYYMLHTVCSLTPGIFSKWQGIAVNLIGFVLSFGLLAYAAYLTAVYPLVKKPAASEDEVLSYRKRGYFLSAAVCTMWGFGGAVISGVMFIRMYQWLTVFVLLCLCIHLKAVASRKMGWKLYASLAVTVFLGFLTQYYYIIFHFFLGAAFCLYLLKEKKWKQLLAYAGACAAGLLAALLYYPSALSHIFKGYRGTEAVGEFADASNTMERLQFFAGLFDKYMIGNMLAVWLLIFCLLAITVWAFRKRGKLSEKLLTLPVVLMLFAAAGYFFTVAKTALLLGETSNRYELPIYGVLVLLLLYSTYMVQTSVLQGFYSRDALKEEADGTFVRRNRDMTVIVLSALMVVLNLTGNKVFFLYPEEAQIQEFIWQKKEVPVVVLYNDASQTHIWWLLDELSEYEHIYLASISGEGDLLNTESFRKGIGAEDGTSGTNDRTGLIVYMTDCENQEEELYRLLGGSSAPAQDRITQDEISQDEMQSDQKVCEKIAEKNMWTIYEVNP